jgi:protein-tyrosine phosphatase
LKAEIRALLRPLVHAVRSVRDRTLHPVRRRRARRIVRAVPEVGSILVLCTGNICRSPYAEKAFHRMLEAAGQAPGEAVGQTPGRAPHGVKVTSGGFLGADRPSPPEAVRLAAARGIDLEAHRSRTVDGEMLAGVDLVIVMERAHAKKLRQVPGGVNVPVILLGDLDPESPDRHEIRDPWGHPDEVFNESFARVERCVHALAGDLGIRARE